MRLVLRTHSLPLEFSQNIPVFWIRDPMLFPDLIHSQKRDPASDVPSADSFYDFLAATPESIHAFLHVFADRGIPASFRNMNGYSGHSFRVVNEAGSAYYVRFHLKAKVGMVYWRRHMHVYSFEY